MAHCVFDTADCAGELWICPGCKRQFCQTHGHVGVKGVNAICDDCEVEQLDVDTPEADSTLNHLDKLTDTLDNL